MKDPILTQELILWILLTCWFVNIDTPDSRLHLFLLLTPPLHSHGPWGSRFTPRLEIKGWFSDINSVNMFVHAQTRNMGVVLDFFFIFLNLTLTLWNLFLFFKTHTPFFPLFFLSKYFFYDTTNNTKTTLCYHSYFFIRNEGVWVRSKRSEDSQWERSIL